MGNRFIVDAKHGIDRGKWTMEKSLHNGAGMNRHAIQQLMTYGIVGLISALIYAVATMMLANSGMLAVIASLIALTPAAAVSYFGHRIFTFVYRGGHLAPAGRYLIQLAIIYLMSSLIHWAGACFGWGPLPGVVIVLTLVPVCSFFALKIWVFTYGPSRQEAIE